MRTCISVSSTFIAGHRLPRELSAKCSNIHGHNYRVRVKVCRDGETPWVMDLDKLYEMLDNISRDLDHAYILAQDQEEVPNAKNVRLPIKIASAEELARWFMDMFEKHGIEGVIYVEVCETDNYCASIER